MYGNRYGGIYHKVPLRYYQNKQELLVDEHNNRFSIFSQIVSCTDEYDRCHQMIALSSKQMKREHSEVSYDVYRDAGCRLRCNGSMTLEMVVVLPLVVTFMVFFLFLFRVLWVQESLEEALVYTAQSLAVNCYDEAETGTHSQALLLAKAQLLLQKGLTQSECPLQYIRGGRGGISLLSSECTGDEIILYATYEMRAPCPLIGNYSYHLMQCARSRKWIGDRSLTEDDPADDTWVYITPEGVAYHRSLSCNYLDLSIHAANRQMLSTMRNASGERYRRCESCKGSAATVYVTDYGTRYHTELSCKGLKRTIYMVRITQTGGRHACRKCGPGSQS